jgi:hypothetical protein
MRAKFIIIFLLIGLLSYTVYQMLRYEQRLRSEKIIKEYIEDDSAPLVNQPSEEDLQQFAEKVDYYFRTSGDIFQSLQFKGESKTLEWDTLMMKGVNLGVAVPGKFPAEFSLTMEEYLAWLRLIGTMNANTIRTYTILPPEFYQAFARYNLLHEDRPLYLLQGVWAPVPESHNYLDASYSRTIQQEVVDVIDVLHGKAVLPPQPGKAEGVYSSDVSQYVSGILFGREWEPDGVIKTNQQSLSTRFQGNFVGVHDASPMEVWLAKMMDFLILYETMTYSMQHPVSFVNWLPLDPLFHNTEFIENEKVREYDNDLERVDFMKFHASPSFFPGIFASYHAYPYYPDFIYLNPRYAQFSQKDGSLNNYAGYLNDLKIHHRGMPLIIAEYGLPSSRGNSHQTPLGLDQGGHDEEAHARLNASLTRDIFEAGCAGAIYFEWADEWFKHNWLVMDFEIPFENRKLWHNMENPEQNFGVLALEAEGEKVMDGLLEDWEISKPEAKRIYTAADPAYFYVMLQTRDLDFQNRDLYFAIDVMPGEAGDHRLPFSEKRFENGFEFLVEIIDRDSARIMVDEPYAIYTDLYNDHIPDYRSAPNENAQFINQRLLTNRGRESLTGARYDSVVFDRSPLRFGNSSEARNSHADWFVNDSTGILEMRLTWHSLNITDPSSGCVLDDVPATPAIECTPTDGIGIQAFVTTSGKQSLYSIPAGRPHVHKWQRWEEPAFQQRLKPLYDSLQVAFEKNSYRPLLPISSTPQDETFKVCEFYQDLPRALSFRFEKGAYSQFEIAHPILEKYHLNATFSFEKEVTQEHATYAVTGSGQRLKRLGWDEIGLLRKAGHQLIEAEAASANSLIPASGLRPAALLDKLEATNRDWLVLQYEAIVNRSGQEDERKSAGIRQISRHDFEKQIRLLRNANYWIAPEEEVFQYQREREQVKIKVNRHRQILFVTLETGLPSAEFDHPLSFYYYTQAPKVAVSGSEDDGFYESRNGRILLNAKPGREVTLKQIW